MSCYLIYYIGFVILVFIFAFFYVMFTPTPSSQPTPESYTNSQISFTDSMYYNNPDCIIDGTCRLSPNNDSFWSYPSVSNLTNLTKIKCLKSTNMPCGCAECANKSTETKLTDCSNNLYSQSCFWKAL